MRAAIGPLNLLSAVIILAGIGTGIGYLVNHPWIGGILGVLFAYYAVPLVLWKESRLLLNVQEWGSLLGVIAIVASFFVIVHWSASGEAKKATAFTGFAVSWQQGLLTDDVSVTCQGAQSGGKPIERADFSLTVYFQTGQKPVVHQYREMWRPNETITVNLPAQGEIERVELAGTGKIDGHDCSLNGAWVSTRTPGQ